MLAWCSIQILVNSKNFKLSLNLSLTHFKAKIACYKLKGDFQDSFENFDITRICMENHAGVRLLAAIAISLLLRYTAENSQDT